MLENWTNQKLEFPEMTQDLGGEYSPISGPLLPLTGSIVGVDRWYPPQDVPKHTRFVIMLNKESFRG